ncbi:hypothetical protein A3K55_01365 [Candidatus Shapirobacteria bacterium RBG_13_44_7]|uniref:Uncharacterized protein n=1 Tax=Candidatus Shapirobacteria bacterium RBG_13_44_7 TaxID=1802149 RepID=A0A1F7SG70_9BACT|nr:MAG: hypothetical protein A3K55_01365 [Candidatus Shapirobacteria bacterium RBG_13_44_7]
MGADNQKLQPQNCKKFVLFLYQDNLKTLKSIINKIGKPAFGPKEVRADILAVSLKSSVLGGREIGEILGGRVPPALWI